MANKKITELENLETSANDDILVIVDASETDETIKTKKQTKQNLLKEVVASVASAAASIATIITDLANHIANTSNPHNVTKSQVGLGNVDNTADADKPVSTATQNALDGKINTTEKGANNGVAELDGTGKVPASQLPSYVDDIEVYADLASFPVTGETGKIYVAEDTNVVYRWNGSGYTEISSSLALGETSTTAYRGDRGKIAYDHSQVVSGNPHNVTKTDVGLGNADNTSDANKPISNATQTALDAKQNALSGLALSTVAPASGDFLVFQDISNASTLVRNTIATILNLVWTATTTGINVVNHLSNTSNPHATTLQQAADAGQATTTSISVGKSSAPNAVVDMQLNNASEMLRHDTIKTYTGNDHRFVEIIHSENFRNNASPVQSTELQYVPNPGSSVTVEYLVNYRRPGVDAINTYKGKSSFHVSVKGAVTLASEQQDTPYEGISAAMAFSCRADTKGVYITALISNNNITIDVVGYYKIIEQYEV